MNKLRKKSLQLTDCWRTIGVWGYGEKRCVELKKYTHCRNCPVFSKIGHSVFERSAPSGYLSQWRKEISSRVEKNNKKINSILMFRVGCEWFGVKASIISEISNERKIHRIPRNANYNISGIVNINGEVKVCYSLNKLLGLNDAQVIKDVKHGHNPKRLIVFDLNEMQYVFLVDEVKGLHWYSDTDILSAPSTLDSENSILLLGSIDHEDKKIAIFNVNKLQERLEGVSP